MTELQDAEARIRAAPLDNTPETRKALLRVIMAPQEQRAEAIGACTGSRTAELLIDLEEDRWTALIVADELKESLH